MDVSPISDTPISSDLWSRLTVAALEDLKGDKQMVLGAELREKMVYLGLKQGLDVATHVQASDHSFSRLIGQVDAVTIVRRAGSDILVGLHGASAPRKWPPKSELWHGPLRSDVYQAFTRVGAEPFVYLPQSDKFVIANMAEGESIKVSGASLDSLIEARRAFVRGLPPDEQEPFFVALDHSTNPLIAFRKVAIDQRKFHQWVDVQADQIRSQVIQWAKDNEITPRDAWFQNPRSRAAGTSPHRALHRLVPYLTADEIRDLRIPFRAVEALLADSTPSE